MKTEEIVQKLIDMSEENAKLSAALRLLKHKYKIESVKEKGYFLRTEEAEEILMIAGMLDKEDVNAMEEKEDAEKLDA